MGKECQEETFEQLKIRLTGSPVLAYPKFVRYFVLETDGNASKIGLGAVLSQTQDDDELHPVAFANRVIFSCETNYGITELETLAVVWAMSHFGTYLYGCHYRSLSSWSCSPEAGLEWETCLAVA